MGIASTIVARSVANMSLVATIAPARATDMDRTLSVRAAAACCVHKNKKKNSFNLNHSHNNLYNYEFLIN